MKYTVRHKFTQRASSARKETLGNAVKIKYPGGSKNCD